MANTSQDGDPNEPSRVDAASATPTTSSSSLEGAQECALGFWRWAAFSSGDHFTECQLESDDCSALARALALPEAPQPHSPECTALLASQRSALERLAQTAPKRWWPTHTWSPHSLDDTPGVVSVAVHGVFDRTGPHGNALPVDAILYAELLFTGTRWVLVALP